MEFEKAVEEIFATKNPSELLEMAIQDMRFIEDNRPDVVFNMGEWGIKDEETGYCEVCVAGAFFYNRLEVLIGQLGDKFWEHKDSNYLAKFFDLIRLGYFSEALIYYFGEETKEVLWWKILFDEKCFTGSNYHYYDDPELFYKSMEEIIYDLKEVGL
jgi:hypothetical protein